MREIGAAFKCRVWQVHLIKVRKRSSSLFLLKWRTSKFICYVTIIVEPRFYMVKLRTRVTDVIIFFRKQSLWFFGSGSRVLCSSFAKDAHIRHGVLWPQKLLLPPPFILVRFYAFKSIATKIDS